MLHTIIPLESVLKGSDNAGESPHEQIRQINGGKLVLSIMPTSGQCSVKNLISSDPRLYLSSRYAPGAVVKVTEQI